MPVSPRQRDHYSDDEICLVDLALILIRRRFWIFGVFLVCVFGGTAYWLMQTPEQYFITTMQIGTYPERDGKQIVERLDNYIWLQQIKMLQEGKEIKPEEHREIINWLNEAIIPRARRELAANKKILEKEVPGIKIEISDDGYLRLESVGTSSNEALIRELHQNIVDSIIMRHNDILEAYVEEVYIEKLEENRNRLSHLTTTQELAKLKLSYTDEHLDFFRSQKK